MSMNPMSQQSKRVVPQLSEYNNKLKQKGGVLNLDKGCISCAGQGSANAQLPQIMKLFKVACLSYNPSSVQFENKTFTRSQLVEA